jgi:hydroxypyruvate isomerase
MSIPTSADKSMPRFSANLGFLFADRPELERVSAAAATGFKAVEMHWPYQVPAAEMRSALERSQVTMLGLNTSVGNAAAGDFGLGAVPGRESEFQQAVDQALSYGSEIGASAVHCMAGAVPADDFEAAERTFVANLRTAADKAAQAGITLLLEPINHRDKPSYFLSRIEQAASIIGQVGRANVKIMFDCYHTQIMQGDLTRRFEAHRELIGHVQIAAVPSRAEPDEGEIDYTWLCHAVDQLGYDGWIGAEYKPRGRTEDGLGWLVRWSGSNISSKTSGGRE